MVQIQRRAAIGLGMPPVLVTVSPLSTSRLRASRQQRAGVGDGVAVRSSPPPLASNVPASLKFIVFSIMLVPNVAFITCRCRSFHRAAVDRGVLQIERACPGRLYRAAGVGHRHAD